MGGVLRSTPNRYDKIEVRRDGPIVQRIGHTPSKGTMLVRFQLGLPGKRVLFFKKRAPMLKKLITKRSHAHVVTSFFWSGDSNSRWRRRRTFCRLRRNNTVFCRP